MSDNIQHIDVDSDEFIDAPKALRDHVKRLQQNNTRLSEQVETYRGQATASALGDVLKEFKNPERVKRDLLSDKVDPLDAEAVKQWLGTNGDDYAKGQAAPTTPETPVVDAAEVQAHQRIAAGAQFSQDADMSKLEAALTEVGANPTPEQLEAAFRKHGA
jgi:hypothetical protein